MINVAQEIIRESTSLPSMPTVVAELSSLLRDDRAGATDFERVVRHDPALTANLLRLANSAYFGLRREISSVRQAIALLGSDRVFELAASAWFCHVLPESIPGYDISAKSLWLHSIAAAVLCEQLTGALRLKPPEMAFTAGLLHDIGKIVIGTQLAKKSEIIVKGTADPAKSFAQIEVEAIGTDHAEVGALLCKSWHLPEALEWSARWHHFPNDCPEYVDQQLVDLVHLSNTIAHSLGFGADVYQITREAKPDTFERLLVDDSALDRVTSDTTVSQIWEMGQLVSGGISC
jgi:putative nucleotidyltransferase with HDIG domain